MALFQGSETSLLLPLYLIIGIAVLSIFLLYLMFIRQTWRWKKANIPFLYPTFLIGHEYFLSSLKSSIVKPIDQIYNENRDKDLVGFFMGTLPVILLNDPKIIHQVMTRNVEKTFATGFFIPESEVEAQYLINTTANKDIWKFGRTVIASEVSPASMQGHKFNMIKEEITRFLQQMEVMESGGQDINIKNATGNVISNYVNSFFGVRNDSDYRKTAMDEFADIIKPSYIRMLAFYTMMISPLFHWFESLRFIPRKHCEAMAEILKQEMHHRDEFKLKRGDFVDVLRSLRENSMLEEDGGKDPAMVSNFKGMNARQMTGISLLLLLASNDTTKGLLQFAIHLLSLEPIIQRKIREETHETMRKNGVTELTYEVVKNLHFTFQCLQEAARLFPLFPVLMRHCSEDFQIPGTNYILRKGDRVIVAPYSIHRNENYYNNPHKFDPERFNAKNRHIILNETFLSFGITPRKCPGANQGMFVAAAIIASLICHYELKPKSHTRQMDASDFHPKSFLVMPKEDLYVDIVHAHRKTDKL